MPWGRQTTEHRSFDALFVLEGHMWRQQNLNEKQPGESRRKVPLRLGNQCGKLAENVPKEEAEKDD